jgi:hypothetical protein
MAVRCKAPAALAAGDRLQQLVRDRGNIHRSPGVMRVAWVVHRPWVSPLLPLARTQSEGDEEDRMEVPPTDGREDDARADAAADLREARDRQRELVERAQAAAGTSDEDEAADALEKVRHEVTGREAWAVWTERGI